MRIGLEIMITLGFYHKVVRRKRVCFRHHVVIRLQQVKFVLVVVHRII